MLLTSYSLRILLFFLLIKRSNTPTTARTATSTTIIVTPGVLRSAVGAGDETLDISNVWVGLQSPSSKIKSLVGIGIMWSGK